MARTVLLGTTPYRVHKRYRYSLSLYPLHTEHPHSLLMLDPMRRDRWGHSHRDSNHVTWYRKIDDDQFVKM